MNIKTRLNRINNSLKNSSNVYVFHYKNGVQECYNRLNAINEIIVNKNQIDGITIKNGYNQKNDFFTFLNLLLFL